MLPRRRRLSREGFDSLSKARRFSSTHFSIAVSENGPHKGFGVVVSKKVARLAVSRHLMKRRIYSILSTFNAEKWAVVVYVRAGAEKIPFSSIESELRQLLQEAGIS